MNKTETSQRAARGTLQLTRPLRAAHDICDEYKDVATASLIENGIDETERRTGFLFEIVGVR